MIGKWSFSINFPGIGRVHKTTQTSSCGEVSPVSPTSSVSSREGLLISLHSDENTPASTPRSGKKTLKLGEQSHLDFRLFREFRVPNHKKKSRTNLITGLMR